MATTLTLAKSPVSTPRLEPTHPGQLATTPEMCKYWLGMDEHFSTPRDSPLHHDNRCEKHVPVLINHWGE